MSWKDILKELSPRERLDAEEFAPQDMQEDKELKEASKKVWPAMLEIKSMIENRRMPQNVTHLSLMKLMEIDKKLDGAKSIEEWNRIVKEELRLHITTVLNNIFDTQDVDKWLETKGFYR